MKKFISIGVFCLLPALGIAEEMKFVTLLARPVGSFATVEATTAKMNTLNLGGENISPVTIEAGKVTIETLNLDASTRLTSTAANFEITDTLTIQGEEDTTPSFRGKNLQAGTLAFESNGKSLSHKMYVKEKLKITQSSPAVESQVAAVENLTITTKVRFVDEKNPHTTDPYGSAAGWKDLACSQEESALDCEEASPLCVGCN